MMSKMKNIYPIFFLILIFLTSVKTLLSQAQPINISVTIDGRTINGQYTIYFGNDNSDLLIRKPFIICEGFDALDNMDAVEISKQINPAGADLQPTVGSSAKLIRAYKKTK
jgi:hypothetical protein